MLTIPELSTEGSARSDESSPVASTYAFWDLPRATDLPCSPGFIRSEVGDFIVVEELPFVPTDEGEHLLIQVRRSNLTTQEVRDRIAQKFRVASKDVGYIGLKDKRSIATQWFSLAISTPSKTISVPDLEILRQCRHIRKLRPSDGCRNWFEIVVRDVNPEMLDFDQMQFVPNYFGRQRFGRDGRNVSNAMKWVRNGKPRVAHFLKSIYISSLRSYVFNQVLAMRVKRGDWRKVIDGEVVLDGSPTGPLWGRGRVLTNDLAQSIEQDVVDSIAPVAEALEWVGLKQERRSLVVEPTNLDCEIRGDIAVVRFALPSGSFATSVLRECFDLHDELN